MAPSSKIPYEGPSRHEILLLISRWNDAHHSVDHIITQAPTELDIAIIDSLKSLDRERVMKDQVVDRDLETLVRDIEMIRNVKSKSDWHKIDYQRIDRGIETLKNVWKLRGKGVNYVAPTPPPTKLELRGGGEKWVTQLEDPSFRKGVNYVAPTLPPRKSELRGGGEAWVTQSEDPSFREAVNREKDKLSLAEKRPREKERQSDLQQSDPKVKRNTDDVLKMISQNVSSPQIKDWKEMFVRERNQEETERITVLEPEVEPNRKVEYEPAFSEVYDQVLQRRSLDGNQPRKDVPREAVRTGNPGSRARPETPGKLQKLTFNVPDPQRGTFYQAPLRPQTQKDQRHAKAPGHQLPVPAIQVLHKSAAHQLPVHVTRTPSKIPDHQKQVNLNTPSSQDLHKRRSHQQLRTHTPGNLHKAASHQHLHTATSRTDPKAAANQHNPQNQHSTIHALRPRKKVSFYEQPVEIILPVKRAPSKGPPSHQQPASHQNTPKSIISAQKGTFYQRPSEANDTRDPTKDPANRVMFNKRPRVATDIKEERMHIAQDEARALASEIRKMED